MINRSCTKSLSLDEKIRKTFKRRYTVERTNKAETQPKEQSEKAESYWENLLNEIQLKGPKRQRDNNNKEDF